MRTFFVPAHITGFFEIKEHKNPMKTGSKGGGVVLDMGVNTDVIIEDADESSLHVFNNGEVCECATTKSVAYEMLSNTEGAFNVEVHHFSKIPLEQGFGLSASGALGTAFAMNHALGLDFDYIKLGRIAHIAEVMNKTGLGDVSAEVSKGMVIRIKEGAPGMGRIKSVPVEGYVVGFIVGKPLQTRTVLEDQTKQRAINTVGKECVKAILKEPTAERFMELSKKFTLESGLAQKNVRKAIKLLEKKGVTAGMCMLGNTVFTITDEPDEISKLLDYPSFMSEPLKKDILDRTV